MAQTKKRRLKHASYKSFRLSKRLKAVRAPLPSVWSLTKTTVTTLKSNWKLFGGISLLYAVLLIFLVRGLTTGQQVTDTKTLLSELGGGGVWNNVLVFGELIGSSAAQSEVSSLYQSILTFIFSLAFIWMFRQTHGKKKAQDVRIRDAFYRGMYPLIPAFLVICVILLQLLPIGLAAVLYVAIIASGFAVTFVEQFAWVSICILLILLSAYMLGSSIMAFFAATLPDVTPSEALRGAKKYVEHRRFIVLAKLLWVGLFILLALAVVILPLIAFIPATAEFAYFLCSTALLPFIIGYMYNLYRALLK